MTVQLHNMQALLTFGSSNICWTPGRSGVDSAWKAGGNLDASIYEGVAD